MSARSDYPTANSQIFRDTENPPLSREIARMVHEIDELRMANLRLAKENKEFKEKIIELVMNS